MSVSVVCPHCGSRLKSAAAPPAGKSIKCPKCGKGFRYEASSAAPVPPPLPEVAPRKGSGGKALSLVFIMLLLGGGAGTAWWLGLLPGVGPRGARGGPAKDGGAEGVTVQKPDDRRDERDAAGGAAAGGAAAGGAAVGGAATGAAATALAAGGETHTAAAALRLPMEIRDPDGSVALALSPDGRTLALAGTNITLRDLATDQKLRTLTFNVNYVEPTRLEFSPDGRHLAASAFDGGKINTHNGAIWSVADGKPVVAFELAETNPRYVMPIVFSPKGTYAAYPAEGHDIVVYDLKRGKEHARLKGHTAWPGALVFSADEAKLFSASLPDYTDQRADRALRMWDLSKPGESRILQKEEHVLPLVATADGKTLFATGSDGVQEWEIPDTGSAVLRHRLNEQANVARLSTDGKTLVLLGGVRSVQWDVEGRKAIGRPLAPEFSGRANFSEKVSALSSDGRTLAVGAGPVVSLWDVATGQKRQEFEPEDDPGDVRTMAFSPDGTIVGAIYRDAVARLWPAESRVAESRATLASRSAVRAIRFSADGKTLAAALIPNQVKNPQTDFPLRRDLEGFRKAWDEREEKIRTAEEAFGELRTKAGNDAAAQQALQRRFEAEVAQPAREFLAAGLQTLSEVHRGDYPPGEMAEVWDLGSDKEVVTLVQPPLAPKEVSRMPGDSDGDFTFRPIVNLSELPDTAPPQPTPLGSLAEERIVWLHRLEGFKTLDVVSRAETTIGKPITAVRYWLLSPDGKTLFVKGRQQTPVTRTIDSFEPGKPDGTETVMENLDVAALVDVATGKARPLTASHFGKSVNPARFPTSTTSACFTPDSARLVAVVEPRPKSLRPVARSRLGTSRAARKLEPSCRSPHGMSAV